MAVNNTYYFRSTGGVWNDANSWSTLSSISPINITGAYPTASDATIFDGNSSGQITIDSQAACATIDCSAYTGDLYFKSDLSVFQSIKLNPNTTVTSDNENHELKIQNCDIDTNAVIIPLTVNFISASPAYSRSLASDINCQHLKATGLIYVSESLTNPVYINVGGNVTQSTGATITYNTTTHTIPVVIRMTGSGEFYNSGYNMVAPFEIDTQGTITFNNTNTHQFGYTTIPDYNFSFKYTNGTVVADQASFLFQGAPNNFKLDASGVNFGEVTLSVNVELIQQLTATTIRTNQNTVGNINISGIQGFVCDNWYLSGNSGNGDTVTLTSDVEYIVNKLLHRSIASSSLMYITSDDVNNKTILTLNGISALNNCVIQRMDASNGFHINTNGGQGTVNITKNNFNVGVSSQNILG